MSGYVERRLRGLRARARRRSAQARLTLTGLTDVVASHRAGSIIYSNATDWLSLASGAAGTILMSNGEAAPSWAAKAGKEDMRVGATVTKIPGVAGPDWEQVGSSGLYLPMFNRGDKANFEAQMSHGYIPATDFLGHIHWEPSDTDTGTVAWIIKYTHAAQDGVFNGTGSSNSGTDLHDAGAGTAYTHQYAGDHAISGTGMTASFCIYGTIERGLGGGDGSDTYTGDPFLISLDFHFQKNRWGLDV